MRKIYFLTVFVLALCAAQAQNIGLSFENPTITTDGVDTFYEVDVMISSDVAFSLGSGQFFLDYNPLAFGTQVDNNGAIAFENLEGTILGGEVIVDVGGTLVPLGDHYTSFISNDTTDSKVSFIFQQNASGGMIGDNIPANAPVPLVHVKITFLDGASAEDPNVCFDATNPFDDQFFTACGPYEPLVGFNFDTADCQAEPGTQIFDYVPDCTGAVIINGITYVWENDTWSPENPEGVATQDDDIEVLSPGAVLTGNLTANNITIAEGGSLDLAANTVSFVGNLEALGTLTADQGTLAVEGTTAQSITGDFNLAQFIMNNSGTEDTSLSGAMNILETVTLTDGTLNTTGGTLTFKSNASTTAMLAPVVDGTIVGNVTVERYMANRRAFRLVTSGVNTASSIQANWQEGVNNVDATNLNPNPGFGTHITGGDAGANGFDDTQNDNASMFVLNNAAQAWEAVSNTDTDILEAGKAYRLMIRGDRGTDLTQGSAAASSVTRLRATGTLATGSVTTTDFSSDAGAFNFFGNPYQASVDMNAVLGASTNVNPNQYFIWDPSLGARGAYVTIALPAGTNTSSSAANQFLQPGQAAFVTTAANGAASVLFTEASKAIGENTATSFTESTQDDVASIVGQLYRTEAFEAGESLQDSFGLFFSPDDSNAVTLQDAPKFFNVDESMATVNGDRTLSIERRAMPQEGEAISLLTTNYRTNVYTLVLTVSTFDQVTPYLVDAFTGQTQALQEGENIIQFTVSENDDSAAENRFSITFADAQLSTSELDSIDVTVFPNPVADANLQVVSSALTGKEVTFSITNILGQELYNSKVQFQGNTLGTSAMRTLPAGLYFVTIASESGTVTKRIIKK